MLNRRTYFIREHAGVFKLKDTYDILDPETQQQIGYASETTPAWALWLRLLVKKRMLPLTIAVREQPESVPLIRIQRGWTLLRSKVAIIDAHGQPIGYFKSKLFSFNGGFYVFNAQDEQVAEVKGSWKNWDFKFLSTSGQELGVVTKKWAGLGRELFTTADNYLISIQDMGEQQAASNALLLAAGLAIDTVFYEQQ
ncbi:phospholipid scramblase-related protein [Hymenobacter endophyticus]|uniref:Phospholipid scramblase-related protein n=1 Tax=Hymenobacter endophyticus TaxID=3076335 RepID=A0ABU3TEB3_9BACT|nr:phospholipid scramblase-related protein [Hymenobacter endophyticus]MDU0369703.1 phospholipid scramblase-related protein [Hymenobacter endophyticus]